MQSYPLRRLSARRGFSRLYRFAEHGFTSRKRSAEHGFTLIEIMVALAVFSLAAMALLRLEGATIRGASTLDATLAAGMVARAIVTETVTDAEAPSPGRTDGRSANGGRDWTWTRRVSSIGDSRVARIDVSVTAPGGQVLATVTAVRPATAATP